MGYRLRTDIIDCWKNENGNVPVLLKISEKGQSRLIDLNLNVETAKWLARDFELATRDFEIVRYVKDQKIEIGVGAPYTVKYVIYPISFPAGYDNHKKMVGVVEIVENLMPNLRMQSNYYYKED